MTLKDVNPCCIGHQRIGHQRNARSFVTCRLSDTPSTLESWSSQMIAFIVGRQARKNHPARAENQCFYQKSGWATMRLENLCDISADFCWLRMRFWQSVFQSLGPCPPMYDWWTVSRYTFQLFWSFPCMWSWSWPCVENKCFFQKSAWAIVWLQDLRDFCDVFYWTCVCTRQATLRTESHALQCATAGPYNAIPSSFLGVGSICGLRPDLVCIHSISFAAHYRVAACSRSLR